MNSFLVFVFRRPTFFLVLLFLLTTIHTNEYEEPVLSSKPKTLLLCSSSEESDPDSPPPRERERENPRLSEGFFLKETWISRLKLRCSLRSTPLKDSDPFANSSKRTRLWLDSSSARFLFFRSRARTAGNERKKGILPPYAPL
jgi:hypothetical protein